MSSVPPTKLALFVVEADDHATSLDLSNLPTGAHVQLYSSKDHYADASYKAGSANEHVVATESNDLEDIQYSLNLGHNKAVDLALAERISDLDGLESDEAYAQAHTLFADVPMKARVNFANLANAIAKAGAGMLKETLQPEFDKVDSAVHEASAKADTHHEAVVTELTAINKLLSETVAKTQQEKALRSFDPNHLTIDTVRALIDMMISTSEGKSLKDTLSNMALYLDERISDLTLESETTRSEPVVFEDAPVASTSQLPIHAPRPVPYRPSVTCPSTPLMSKSTIADNLFRELSETSETSSPSSGVYSDLPEDIRVTQPRTAEVHNKSFEWPLSRTAPISEFPAEHYHHLLVPTAAEGVIHWTEFGSFTVADMIVTLVFPHSTRITRRSGVYSVTAHRFFALLCFQWDGICYPIEVSGDAHAGYGFFTGSTKLLSRFGASLTGNVATILAWGRTRNVNAFPSWTRIYPSKLAENMMSPQSVTFAPHEALNLPEEFFKSITVELQRFFVSPPPMNTINQPWTMEYLDAFCEMCPNVLQGVTNVDAAPPKGLPLNVVEKFDINFKGNSELCSFWYKLSNWFIEFAFVMGSRNAMRAMVASYGEVFYLASTVDPMLAQFIQYLPTRAVMGIDGLSHAAISHQVGWSASVKSRRQGQVWRFIGPDKSTVYHLCHGCLLAYNTHFEAAMCALIHRLTHGWTRVSSGFIYTEVGYTTLTKAHPNPGSYPVVSPLSSDETVSQMWSPHRVALTECFDAHRRMNVVRYDPNRVVSNYITSISMALYF